MHLITSVSPARHCFVSVPASFFGSTGIPTQHQLLRVTWQQLVVYVGWCGGITPASQERAECIVLPAQLATCVGLQENVRVEGERTPARTTARTATKHTTRWGVSCSCSCSCSCSSSCSCRDGDVMYSSMFASERCPFSYCRHGACHARVVRCMGDAPAQCRVDGTASVRTGTHMEQRACWQPLLAASSARDA